VHDIPEVIEFMTELLIWNSWSLQCWLVENHGKRMSKVKVVVFNGSKIGQLRQEQHTTSRWFYFFL